MIALNIAKIAKSVYLGLREKVESSFKNMFDDMFNKFKNKGGLLKELKKLIKHFQDMLMMTSYKTSTVR